MSETITVNTGVTLDERMRYLTVKWKNLKRVLSGDNECFGCEEWKELDEEFCPKGPVEVPVDPSLPPSLPASFPNDGPNVRKAEVVRSYLNKRLFGANVFSASGRPGDTVNLWVAKGSLVRVGWAVYVKPNVNPSEEGYVLQGIYNKYGDRLE